MDTTKQQIRLNREQAWLNAGTEVSKEAIGAIKVFLANPIVSMVGAVTLIEFLQRWKVGTGEFAWQSQPGTHALVYKEIETPIISQSLATTLETAIITAETIKSLGGVNPLTLLQKILPGV